MLSDKSSVHIHFAFETKISLEWKICFHTEQVEYNSHYIILIQLIVSIFEKSSNI